MKFANYPGTGRVVAVILRTLTASAAYTPSLSFGCYPESPDDEESCQVLGKLLFFRKPYVHLNRKCINVNFLYVRCSLATCFVTKKKNMNHLNSFSSSLKHS